MSESGRDPFATDCRTISSSLFARKPRWRHPPSNTLIYMPLHIFPDNFFFFLRRSLNRDQGFKYIEGENKNNTELIRLDWRIIVLFFMISLNGRKSCSSLFLFSSFLCTSTKYGTKTDPAPQLIFIVSIYFLNVWQIDSIYILAMTNTLLLLLVIHLEDYYRMYQIILRIITILFSSMPTNKLLFYGIANNTLLWNFIKGTGFVFCPVWGHDRTDFMFQLQDWSVFEV